MVAVPVRFAVTSPVVLFTVTRELEEVKLTLPSPAMLSTRISGVYFWPTPSVRLPSGKEILAALASRTLKGTPALTQYCWMAEPFMPYTVRFGQFANTGPLV